jgi:hypothetical protein
MPDHLPDPNCIRGKGTGRNLTSGFRCGTCQPALWAGLSRVQNGSVGRVTRLLRELEREEEQG